MYDCGNRVTREACPVFPGIELVYRDGTAGGAAEGAIGYGSGGLIGICHCREGRMEWEDRDGFCYVEQGGLLIARLGGDFRDCRFPTGRYRGISVLLDVDRAPRCLSCYAEEVYVVSSGEMMSLYAANNIAAAIRNFGKRGYARLRGLILNAKNLENEVEIVNQALGEIGTELIQYIPRCAEIQEAENQGGTVFEFLRDSRMQAVYDELADKILAGA